MSLEVSDLSKSYGAQQAVNHISFEVGKGEIVGFLGPNGAGKSTTMKMITGFLQPDSGSIKVDGIDTLMSPLESKKRIGYLAEANPLYYDMYVKEYLSFIAGLHRIHDASKKVEASIATVGLTPERHKKIGQLSKGYKQRVGLAAALVHDPQVLILDEPTSGLDPNQIAEIRNVIKEFSANKTVLFSTHIMQEVEAMCDRVIIINKGNVVADNDLVSLRSKTADAVIIVQFDKEITADALSGIPSVTISADADKRIWRISSNNIDQTRKALMQFSVENNLSIISLQNETASLETVFRSLTT